MAYVAAWIRWRLTFGRMTVWRDIPELTMEEWSVYSVAIEGDVVGRVEGFEDP